MGAIVEAPVGGEVPRHGLVEVVRTFRAVRFVALLGVVARPGEVAVEEARHELVRRHRERCGKTHVVGPAPRVLGRVAHGPGTHLGS